MDNLIPQNTKIPQFISISTDIYHAIHITITEPAPQHQLLTFLLQFSQSQQTNPSCSAIWITLTPPKLALAGALCDNNFYIHSGLDKKIVVYRWMGGPEGKKCSIPAFSVFYIGCGAVLVRNQCVFMVQEKSGERKGKWNVPSGRADPGETIAQCVERQLFEETNIKAKYKFILHFREQTKAIYNCVDVYYACLMQFDQKALEDMKLCQRQIMNSRWVPLSQYHQFTLSNSNKTQIMLAEYVTKIWKQGFDFSKNSTNNTRFLEETLNIKTQQKRKLAYHEPIFQKQ